MRSSCDGRSSGSEEGAAEGASTAFGFLVRDSEGADHDTSARLLTLAGSLSAHSCLGWLDSAEPIQPVEKLLFAFRFGPSRTADGGRAFVDVKG